LELDARLAASEAEWKLVVGHHPVRNQHMPENTPELMQHLEPVLEAQVLLPETPCVVVLFSKDLYDPA
jgi:hypothetical protein